MGGNVSKPISVQLYSVREHMAEDRDATLRRIAGIGYQAVEPYSPADDPKGFKALRPYLRMTPQPNK